ASDLIGRQTAGVEDLAHAGGISERDNAAAVVHDEHPATTETIRSLKEALVRLELVEQGANDLEVICFWNERVNGISEKRNRFITLNCVLNFEVRMNSETQAAANVDRPP